MPLLARAQSGLDPAAILKPLSDEWLTYAGDYSGRRYSSLTQINQTTVKSLGLAWISRGFSHTAWMRLVRGLRNLIRARYSTRGEP